MGRWIPWLPACWCWLGTATRLAQFYAQQIKTYEGEIDLGVVSDTYDTDGEVQSTGIALPPLAEVIAALDRFRGRIQQTPPPFSAKKIHGVPAYKLARKNIEVELKTVEVEISELQVLEQAPGRIKIRVSCSAGTYVRSLAHDLGQTLGCGAVLSRLRRVSRTPRRCTQRGRTAGASRRGAPRGLRDSGQQPAAAVSDGACGFGA